MEFLKNSTKKDLRVAKINPLTIGGAIFAIIVVVLLVFSLMKIFRTNQFGVGTKIDNLTLEYKNLPQIKQDMIFNYLYQTIALNLPEGTEVPESGALIREGTAEYEHNETTGIYYGKFIVDIPSVEQSYRVQFEWSPTDKNQDLGGYPVVITCLPRSLQKYDNASCNVLVEVDSFWKNAFQLDYTFGARTSSIIRNAIGNYLINQIEVDGYTIKIDEATIRRDKSQPGLAYRFDIILDDKYKFAVLVRMDETYGNEYIAFYLNGENIKAGFIFADSKEQILEDWLKSVSDDENLEIIKKNLLRLEN